jgi:hypothetical protein
VTNALGVLEKPNGLIARDGKRGRAIVWRFVITDVDVSRPPDTLPVDNREAADNNMSRIPDTSEGNVSGVVMVGRIGLYGYLKIKTPYRTRIRRCRDPAAVLAKRLDR